MKDRLLGDRDIVLRAEGINVVKNKKTILRDVNVAIRRGECLGLVGPNGSGKSTLLKIISMLEQPTGGRIYWEGQLLPTQIPMSIRHQIAIVFQEPLLLNKNVYQNVALGLKFRRLPKKEIKSRVEYWLETFGISHLAKQHAHSLSGGEAQRTSLARAFALNPQILFLDEPFSALDAPTIEELLGDLKKVFESTGVTTLIVSHNFRDINRLANRMLVLLGGQIKASGTKEDIFSQEHDPETNLFLNQLALV
ncbi:MAG: ATP-binding cassette domain-containing protein [Peptococcaceae bacterium]|nr:ATP-binding cassette domain-containing protein [Peptococcaceae bacterium]